MRISLYDYCMEYGKEYLLSQWDTTRNGECTPHNIGKTSSRIVWWKCEYGHSWQTQVKSRIGGTGCPYCLKNKQQAKREARLKTQK